MSAEPEGQDKRRSPLLLRLPWLRLLAEFGVIFLGVTLSLLADDWRQSQTDRDDERRALREVLVDLELDHGRLGSLRADMAGDDRAAMWIYRRMGTSEGNVDSLMAALATIQSRNMYQTPGATFEGLRSTGKLTLIRADSLRRDLTRYYEERQPYLLQFNEAYGAMWLSFTESYALDVDIVFEPGVESFSSRSGFVMRLRTPWDRFPTDPMARHWLLNVGILAGLLDLRIGEVLEENVGLQEAIRAYLDGAI